FSNPVSTLKKVVFPAPFGPMRATIEPASTWNSSTDTATTPPKERCTPRTVRIGEPAGTGPALTRWVASGVGAPSVATESSLLAVTEHALRPEHQQQDDREPHEHVADGAGLGRGDEPPAVVADRLGEDAVQRRDDEPVDHRPDGRAQH